MFVGILVVLPFVVKYINSINDSGENLDFRYEDHTKFPLETNYITYGIRKSAALYSQGAEQMIKTYVVEKPLVKVGALVTPTMSLCEKNEVFSDVYGQVYYIYQKDHQYEIYIYNFQNLEFLVYLSADEFLQITPETQITAVINNLEISLNINYISKWQVNKKIEIALSIADYSKLNVGLVEGGNFEIYFAIGKLENQLTLPASVYLHNNQYVMIIRGTKEFNTRIKIGQIGFHYYQILNTDLEPGDILVYR